MNVSVDIARLMGDLEELARFTDCPQTADPDLPEPQRAVTRVVFTRQDLAARAWLRERVREAGFTWREDAVGNTFIRWAGTAPELPAVATGSHIDAIPFAGMYDGTVGVLGGLESLRCLREAGFQPTRSLELVLFTSEEPTRFGIGCLGSRLLSGQLDPERADTMPDRLAETEVQTDTKAEASGTLNSVRQAAGFHGALAGVALPPNTYAAWVELHIEQGPLLERSKHDLGVVTHIAGPASCRYTVKGHGGHAGALLMPDRRDALCAAAELTLAIERAALEANQASGSSNTVATVGKLDVFPGAVNAVPSRVTLLLDLRDTDLTSRDQAITNIRDAVTGIAARRDVAIHEELLNADAPTVCDAGVIDVLENSALRLGLQAQRMVSRAYHDTTFMARIAPVAMLFIPCRGGVSHRPDEYASPEAIALGTRVLAETLASLSGGVGQALPDLDQG